MKRAAVVLAWLALLLIGLAIIVAAVEAKTSCKTRTCNARVAHRHCDQQHPRWCVEHVIFHRRLAGTWKAGWLRRIPACESTWNPYAVSPAGHSGLYQFHPETWAGTPYGHRRILSAFWQPYAAAWMLDQGRVGEWACK